jgi:hypothetical protein
VYENRPLQLLITTSFELGITKLRGGLVGNLDMIVISTYQNSMIGPTPIPFNLQFDTRSIFPTAIVFRPSCWGSYLLGPIVRPTVCNDPDRCSDAWGHVGTADASA